jgi:hypothetical protein
MPAGLRKPLGADELPRRPCALRRLWASGQAASHSRSARTATIYKKWLELRVDREGRRADRGQLCQRKSEQEIVEKLEERAGPQARALLEKFIEDVEKLEAKVG